jgi:selenocysteine lyase/cysteine desulfurase
LPIAIARRAAYSHNCVYGREHVVNRSRQKIGGTRNVRVERRLLRMTVMERLGHAKDGVVRAGCACYTTREEVERLIEE